jgi:hypothetical protein
MNFSPQKKADHLEMNNFILKRCEKQKKTLTRFLRLEVFSFANGSELLYKISLLDHKTRLEIVNSPGILFQDKILTQKK